MLDHRRDGGGMMLLLSWAHGVDADDGIEPLRKTHLIYECGGETLIFVGADGKLYAARMQFVHCVHESGISLTMAREIFAIIFKQPRQIFRHQFVGRSARNLKATLQQHLRSASDTWLYLFYCQRRVANLLRPVYTRRRKAPVSCWQGHIRIGR